MKSCTNFAFNLKDMQWIYMSLVLSKILVGYDQSKTILKTIFKSSWSLHCGKTFFWWTFLLVYNPFKSSRDDFGANNFIDVKHSELPHLNINHFSSVQKMFSYHYFHGTYWWDIHSSHQWDFTKKVKKIRTETYLPKYFLRKFLWWGLIIRCESRLAITQGLT